MTDGEQRRANYITEILGGVSVVAMAGLIWFTAQQSKKIDDTERAVSETRADVREIMSTLWEVKTNSVQAAANTESIEREIKRNERRIDRLERELGGIRSPSQPEEGESPYRGGFP